MEHDSLGWAIIVILLLIMIAPVAAGFLFIIWLLKKVYQTMTMNNERYCYIAYKHNLIRYNTKEVEKLKGLVQAFRTENNVIC